MAGQGQGGDFGWQMNDATTQMGVQFGKSAVAAGQDYVEKNVSLSQLSHLSYILSFAYYSVLTSVYPLPPLDPHQNLFRSNKLLCPPQAPPNPLPMAS